MTKREFTAVYQKHGKWYVAWVEEVPGALTQGKTLKEARENLKEALQMVLDFNYQQAENSGYNLKREPLTLMSPSLSG